ncbi:MAG: NuoM [Acidilobaceae archaeon]|nr:NuoM [Acidilobaceae archaeon]MCX8165794.1 proton-conducting transporter membrane subunit [Acidilobaceae archaeon]MDW7974219.1 proton-conducting transporter membrane subunit [Sulfolobales archaeon]
MELPLPLLWTSVLLPPILAILSALNRDLLRYSVALSSLLFLLPAAVGLYYVGYAGERSVADPFSINLQQYSLGSFYLIVDGLSLPVIVGISIVTALVAIYSMRYMSQRIEELEKEGTKVPGMAAYFLLYNAFSSSMLGMALSSNLLLFFIFLEISLLTSFALIAYYGYGDRMRISLLYFIWTHVAGALFLIGTLFYGIGAGSFDVLLGSSYNKAFLNVQAEGLLFLAPLFIVLGLLIKMAITGVHMWLPYAHAEAPTPISALLSPNLIGIAGYAMARFGLTLFPSFMESIANALLFLAVLTILYGAFVALKQNDFKRFLAYSSISQMGYLLLGISTLTYFGIAGAMLHYLSHAIGKAVLFMIAGIFITELHGLRDMNKMGGLARAYPITAALALLGFMHLAGIPPSVGLWGELLILLGVVEAFSPLTPLSLLLVTLVLVLSFIMTAVYSFVAMRKIFFGPPKINAREELDLFKGSVLVMGALGILLFIIAGLLVSPAQGAVELLLEALR